MTEAKANLDAESPADESADNTGRPISRMERLHRRGSAKLDLLLPRGHTAGLESCVGTLHLALSCLDGVPVPERPPLLRKIADRLVLAYQVGTSALNEPVQSELPFAFVVSYPRSGNTAVTQSLAALFAGQVLEGYPHGLHPFSKALYPKHYPLVRLVKDHVARAEYLQDKVLIVVRDGRDTMISLAYMTLKQGRHDFARKGELASFIRWLDTYYPFGGWAQHLREVKALLAGPDKHLLRYNDYMSSLKTLHSAASFIDPEHGHSDKEISEAFHAAQRIPKALENHSVNDQWGFGMQFEPDSLFHEWAQNRQHSHWQLAWGREAKAAFHETGATDFLLEFGFETDPDWWKRES